MTSPVWPPVLGTPLSPAATRVLLPGAGEPGKEVIIALQRLGVEVIGADRCAGAPGHQIAHRAHVLNMADPAALEELIARERAQIIVPEFEAIAPDALVEIERAGPARVVPTARAADVEAARALARRAAACVRPVPIT